jgi:iron complex outermembrane receptor protein
MEAGMIKNTKHTLLATSAFVLSTLAASAAMAQTTGSSQLSDIVVTARRTNEKLQDVPLAVTAATASFIQDNKIVSFDDLNGLVPSLNYQPNYERTGTGAIFFRGLTNGAGGLGSKASVFLDGNYMATNAVDIPFNLFQQIEALPGPQSAQFGRATFGGALNYVTKDPTRKPSIVIHADYASYGDLNLDGLFSGPLIKGGDLRGLLFVSHSSYDAPDSWKSSPDILHPNGVRQWSQNEDYVAGKLTWDATQDLQIKLFASYANINDGPEAFSVASPNYVTSSLPYYTGFNQATPQAGASRPFLVGSAAALENSAGVAGTTNQSNYYNIPDPNVHDTSERIAAKINYGFWNGFNATLNVSFENQRMRDQGVDFDFTPYPASLDKNQSIDSQATAVELRIASPQEKRLRGAVGVYTLYQQTKNGGIFSGSYSCTSVTPTSYVPCMPTSPAATFNPTYANGNLVGFTGTSVFAPFSTSLASGTSVNDLSGFGMLSYDITSKLTFNFEGRYQTEKQYSTNFAAFTGRATFNAFLPRVGLEYKVTPTIMTYALYSIGDNPGGFNAAAAADVALGAPSSVLQYDEEKLYNYEIGFKSQFFDRRVTLNMAAYHEDWDNQTSITTAITPINNVSYVYTSNLGKSAVNGVEASLDWKPMAGWTIGSTISYNSAKYVNYCDTTEPAILSYYTNASQKCISVNGKALVNVPPLTASLTSDYRWTAFSNVEFDVGATYKHRDGQYAETENITYSKGVDQVDLRLSAAKGPVKIMVFCSNCTNDHGTNRVTTMNDPEYGSAFGRQVSLNPTRPAQVGVKATFTY